MAKSSAFTKRKPSGGRFRSNKKKKAYEMASEPTLTKLSKISIKKIRTMGGHIKFKLLTADIANVYDPKSKKYKKAKITTITENPANPHFVRRNIMTKGTIIETDIGKARITSRPGQQNAINAILI